MWRPLFCFVVVVLATVVAAGPCVIQLNNVFDFEQGFDFCSSGETVLVFESTVYFTVLSNISGLWYPHGFGNSFWLWGTYFYETFVIPVDPSGEAERFTLTPYYYYSDPAPQAMVTTIVGSSFSSWDTPQPPAGFWYLFENTTPSPVLCTVQTQLLINLNNYQPALGLVSSPTSTDIIDALYALVQPVNGVSSMWYTQQLVPVGQILLYGNIPVNGGILPTFVLEAHPVVYSKTTIPPDDPQSVRTQLFLGGGISFYTYTVQVPDTWDAASSVLLVQAAPSSLSVSVLQSMALYTVVSGTVFPQHLRTVDYGVDLPQPYTASSGPAVAAQILPVPPGSNVTVVISTYTPVSTLNLAVVAAINTIPVVAESGNGNAFSGSTTSPLFIPFLLSLPNGPNQVTLTSSSQSFYLAAIVWFPDTQNAYLWPQWQFDVTQWSAQVAFPIVTDNWLTLVMVSYAAPYVTSPPETLNVRVSRAEIHTWTPSLVAQQVHLIQGTAVFQISATPSLSLFLLLTNNDTSTQFAMSYSTSFQNKIAAKLHFLPVCTVIPIADGVSSLKVDVTSLYDSSDSSVSMTAAIVQPLLGNSTVAVHWNAVNQSLAVSNFVLDSTSWNSHHLRMNISSMPGVNVNIDSIQIYNEMGTMFRTESVKASSAVLFLNEQTNDFKTAVVSVQVHDCVMIDSGQPCLDKMPVLLVNCSGFNVQIIQPNVAYPVTLHQDELMFFWWQPQLLGVNFAVNSNNALGVCMAWQPNKWPYQASCSNMQNSWWFSNGSILTNQTVSAYCPTGSETSSQGVYVLFHCFNSANGCTFQFAAQGRNTTALNNFKTAKIYPQRFVQWDNLVTVLNHIVSASMYQLWVYEAFQPDWPSPRQLGQQFGSAWSISASAGTFVATFDQGTYFFDRNLEPLASVTGCGSSTGRLLAVGDDFIVMLGNFNSLVFGSLSPQAMYTFVEEWLVHPTGTEGDVIALAASGSTAAAVVVNVANGVASNRLFLWNRQGYGMYEQEQVMLFCLGHFPPSSSNVVSLSISGNMLVVSSGTCVSLYDIERHLEASPITCEVCAKDANFGHAVSLSPDGQWLAVSGTNCAYLFQCLKDVSFTFNGTLPGYLQWAYDSEDAKGPASLMRVGLFGNSTMTGPGLLMMVATTPAVSFTDEYGVAALQAVPPGSMFLPQNKSTVLCPTGTFSADTSIGPCVLCPPGTYAEHEGSVECTSCGHSDAWSCSPGSERPLYSNFTETTQQQTSFVVDPLIEQPEELLIRAMFINTQLPFAKVVYGLAVALTVFTIIVFSIRFCPRAEKYRVRLTKILKAADREKEVVFDPKQQKMVSHGSMVGGALAITLYAVLIVGLAWGIMYASSYKPCELPEGWSYAEAAGWEAAYNGRASPEVLSSEELEELCPSSSGNILRQSSLVAPSGVPSDLTALATFMRTRNPSNISVILLGYRAILGRSLADVCSDISVTAIGCEDTEGLPCAVCNCTQPEEYSDVLVATVTFPEVYELSPTAKISFVFPLDVLATDVLGLWYMPALSDIDGQESASTATSWIRVAPSTPIERVLHQLDFSIDYTITLRQSGESRLGLVSFSSQSTVKTVPAPGQRMTVNFELQQTAFLIYQLEQPKLTSIALFFTLGLAFIGLYEFVEFLTSLIHLTSHWCKKGMKRVRSISTAHKKPQDGKHHHGKREMYELQEPLTSAQL